MISGGSLDYDGYPLDYGFTALVSDGRSLDRLWISLVNGKRALDSWCSVGYGFVECSGQNHKRGGICRPFMINIQAVSLLPNIHAGHYNLPCRYYSLSF